VVQNGTGRIDAIHGKTSALGGSFRFALFPPPTLFRLGIQKRERHRTLAFGKVAAFVARLHEGNQFLFGFKLQHFVLRLDTYDLARALPVASVDNGLAGRAVNTSNRDRVALAVRLDIFREARQFVCG
jgi:hypothetical protein